MTWEDLMEELAAKEHASWSRWMVYLFSKGDILPSGSLRIPSALFQHWKRQAETPYADLTEEEKESDRKEVREILPILEKYWEGDNS